MFDSSDEKWKSCSLLLLELLHRLIPHLSLQNTTCKVRSDARVFLQVSLSPVFTTCKVRSGAGTSAQVVHPPVWTEHCQ